MKLLPAEEAVRRVTPALSKAKGRLTVADTSAATGLALEDARTALEKLMNTYVCRLQVTESGEILYDFGGSLRRRGERTFREVLADLEDLAWRAFRVVFKAWITVTLVVYFTTFVVITIALMIASQGRDSKKIRLGWIFDLLGDLFIVRHNTMAMVYATDSYGYRHKSYRQTTRADRDTLEPRKRLVQSVYDFVFGPPRPDFDPFANEKEVIAWLRENKGLLTPTEIVALAGWTFDEASERMADYLTRFSGEPDITDDGVLVGRFDKVLQSGDGELAGGKIELFWDEYEAPFEITGNSKTRNAAIGGMNAFNLLFALGVTYDPGLREIIVELARGFVSAPFVELSLGWIPLLFSIIFFAVPVVRAVRTHRLESARMERNKRRRVIRVIFMMMGRDLTFREICDAVNHGPQVALKEAEVQRILDRVTLELHGRTELRDDGTVIYRFERIHQETVTASRIRETAQIEGPGAVVFDTGAAS